MNLSVETQFGHNTVELISGAASPVPVAASAAGDTAGASARFPGLLVAEIAAGPRDRR